MQRTKLIQTFHSETVATRKLSIYVDEIRSHLGLSYTSLILVSKALWLHSSMTATMSGTAPHLPSPTELLDEYSVARQLQEMALEDPQASLTEYSMDDDLPSDIEALCTSHVCHPIEPWRFLLRVSQCVHAAVATRCLPVLSKTSICSASLYLKRLCVHP